MKHALILPIICLMLAGCAVDRTASTLVPTITLPTENVPPTLTWTVTPAPTQTPAETATPTQLPATATPTPAVLIGAGDIAMCGEENQGDEQTAHLLDQLIARFPQAAVFTDGDTAYGDGTSAELKNCFGPTWGRHLDRIHPAAGNHDYMTDSGAPYYNYFGAAAGEAGIGYYSYDLGDWHIVVLNSNCNDIACGPDSKQVQWLSADLQDHPNRCTLAYWHHPRWSSGIAGGSGSVNSFWRTAADMGVDVVVNGHDHDYERFAPMDGEGNANLQGTREFVVGTGGGVLRTWGTLKANSEVRYSGTYGVIQFSLFPDHYTWQFLSTGDSAMTDQGSGSCH